MFESVVLVFAIHIDSDTVELFIDLNALKRGGVDQLKRCTLQRQILISRTHGPRDLEFRSASNSILDIVQIKFKLSRGNTIWSDSNLEKTRVIGRTYL